VLTHGPTRGAFVWCDGRMDVAADLAVTCPRCGNEVHSRFYGPCESCRTQLRAAYAGLAREVEVAEYVPKMNVTPNAVALKDD
jgi:predicted RNA-binding Zn-ribbon protein involved in translation (DUF1610 family)